MTKRDYIEQQKRACETEWFKHHEAVWIDKPTTGLISNGAAIISWQASTSWNYGCRFIIHRRWLCVVGDIGEATFEWGQDLTLEFLEGMDFGYFLSKCRASESGKDFNYWMGDFCVQELKDFLKDDERSDKAELIEEAEGYTSDEREWTSFLYQSGNNLQDDDYSLADAGSVPHPRAIGMFVGLQMAIKRLNQP